MRKAAYDWSYSFTTPLRGCGPIDRFAVDWVGKEEEEENKILHPIMYFPS